MCRRYLTFFLKCYNEYNDFTRPGLEPRASSVALFPDNGLEYVESISVSENVYGGGVLIHAALLGSLVARASA